MPDTLVQPLEADMIVRRKRVEEGERSRGFGERRVEGASSPTRFNSTRSELNSSHSLALFFPILLLHLDSVQCSSITYRPAQNDISFHAKQSCKSTRRQKNRSRRAPGLSAPRGDSPISQPRPKLFHAFTESSFSFELRRPVEF